MTAILAKFFFDTVIGKAVAAGAVVVVLFGAWLVQHDAKVADRAKNQIVDASKKQGKVANENAQKAHRAAERPGAAKRLLAEDCRDCGR